MIAPSDGGRRSGKGERLVTMERDLIEAQLDKASATRRQAELDLQRIERLMKQKLASDDQLARSRTALDVARAEERVLQTRLQYTQIDAPFDGVLSARLASPGDIAPRLDEVACRAPLSFTSRHTMDSLTRNRLRAWLCSPPTDSS